MIGEDRYAGVLAEHHPSLRRSSAIAATSRPSIRAPLGRTTTGRDGQVQAGVEECDDGNAVDTDACLSTCVAAKCGDGQVQEGVEECDDGNDAPALGGPPTHGDTPRDVLHPEDVADGVVGVALDVIPLGLGVLGWAIGANPAAVGWERPSCSRPVASTRR
ncbi:MAG: DUF4215 domain-containing protein [Nannocystaceae bacterium]